LSLNRVSWFEIGLVKSAPNTTDGIPLHVKRLCVIERMRGTSEGLKTHAYWNSFANMLGELDRPLPGNDFPNSNGASGSLWRALHSDPPETFVCTESLPRS
jgi:hypothetical protein